MIFDDNENDMKMMITFSLSFSPAHAHMCLRTWHMKPGPRPNTNMHKRRTILNNPLKVNGLKTQYLFFMIHEISAYGMDKCFVAYDSLNESSYLCRFNATTIFFQTKLYRTFQCNFSSNKKNTKIMISKWILTKKTMHMLW